MDAPADLLEACEKAGVAVLGTPVPTTLTIQPGTFIFGSKANQGTLVVDDLNQYEAEKLVEKYRPDLFCAGIKEKYSIQKLGIPMKQLHSYDSGGPYAGFRGAVNFYREIDRLVTSRVWGLMQAPWQEHPELSATYVWE